MKDKDNAEKSLARKQALNGLLNFVVLAAFVIMLVGWVIKVDTGLCVVFLLLVGIMDVLSCIYREMGE